MSGNGDGEPRRHGGTEDGNDEMGLTTGSTQEAVDFVTVVTPEAQTRLDLLARAEKAEKRVAELERTDEVVSGGHDAWCNVAGAGPVGCPGCSCTVTRRAKDAEAERDKLAEQWNESARIAAEALAECNKLKAALAECEKDRDLFKSYASQRRSHIGRLKRHLDEVRTQLKGRAKERDEARAERDRFEAGLQAIVLGDAGQTTLGDKVEMQAFAGDVLRGTWQPKGDS